jgi:hypothetical protein
MSRMTNLKSLKSSGATGVGVICDPSLTPGDATYETWVRLRMSQSQTYHT